MRADTLRTVVEVATHLARAADWSSMTSRPTWEALGERSGRSRSTVARVLAKLRAARLLGVVVTGRSAGFTPMALDEGRAEAALYVLAVPSPVSAVPGPSSGDEDDTPTAPLSGEPKSPIRARTRGKKRQTEPLRGQPVEAGQARPTPPTLCVVTTPWSRFATAKRRDERLAASFALKRQLPVLRSLSDAKLASLLREFVVAGWTNDDLVYGLDHQVDGTPWPHSGAHGVKNPAGWLTHRLSAWRDDERTVRRSRSQRVAAADSERRARHRADAELRERDRAGRVSPSLPHVASLLAEAREVVRANALRIRRGRD